MSNELANMKKLLYRTISSEYTSDELKSDKLEIELFDYLAPTNIDNNCVIKTYLKFYNNDDECLGDMTFTFSSSYSNTTEKIAVNDVKSSITFIDNCSYLVNEVDKTNKKRFIFIISDNKDNVKVYSVAVNFEIISGYLEDIRCKEYDADASTPTGIGNSISINEMTYYSNNIYSGSFKYITGADEKTENIGYRNQFTKEGVFVNNDNNVNVISLTKAGEVTAQSFNAQSDKRLKTNIVDYSPNKSILDLPIKEFDYITTEKHAIGCIAQDLQEICPEIVDEDDKGYLSIQESKIVYLLLDEVKKLRKELDELKERE